jgi:outer membrane receptor protein involved in Fe transport
MRNAVRRCAHGAAVVALAAASWGSPRLARADDPPPPPPPAPEVFPAPAPAPVPVPSSPTPPPPPPPSPVLPEPPPPPPPDVEMPSWDKGFRNRSLPLPPPPPPPDPFAERPIRWRHDRLASLDGRLTQIKRIPQWVDVVDRSEMQEWRPADFGEILRRLPNVQMADGGSPFLASPIIRGLGGDRVKVVTDGVWPATQALGAAGSTVTLWDPESIERVEVYHGPGAWLRGVEAGGGVINMVPRRPTRHPCPTVIGEASTAWNSADNRFREHLGAEVGSGRVAALGGITYEDRGDRDTASGSLDPTTFQWFAGSLALDYFLDNQSTIGITAQYVKAEDIRTPLGIGFTQPEYHRTFLALTISSFDVGSVFHGTRASVSFAQFLQEDDSQTSLSLTNGVSAQDDVTRFDLRLQGRLYLVECHDTWAELSVSYAHVERREEILPSTAPPPVEELGTAAGDLGTRVHPTAVPGQPVFGVAQYVANEWKVKALIEDEWHNSCWDFKGGVGLDYWWLEDDRSGQNREEFLVSVAGGVAHHIGDCVTVYGNASFGARHPSLFETFDLTVIDGLTVFPNPDLDDEQNLAGEVGVKTAFWNHTTFQTALFAHHIKDFIGRETVGVDQIWDNIGDVTLYGVEVQGSWRPNPCLCEGLEVFGNGAFTATTDEDVAPDVPFHGRAGARLSRGCGPVCGIRRWFVEGAARGGSGSGRDGDDDAFVTAEFLGGIGWGSGNKVAWWLNGGVTNLFDADYVEPFSRLPTMGRSFFLSFEATF